MKPWPSSLVVASEQVIPAQCEGVVMAQFESPLRVEDGLIEPNPEAHALEGLYIARTLARDRCEVRVRVLSATLHDQKFMKGSPMVHCEPGMLVTPPTVEQSHVRDTTPKLQDVVAAARQNLNDTESQEFEEVVEYRSTETSLL
jgi:hypothetical protein